MVSSHDMLCQQMVELVTDYLEGKLSPLERALFETHIRVCPNCSTYLEQMRQTIQLMGKLTPDSLPRHAQAELLQVFLQWKVSLKYEG